MMLLLAVQALYVGNHACAPCHADIVRQYSPTPMSLSSGVVKDNVPPGSFRQASSGTEYRIRSSGVVEAAKGSRRSEYQLDYVIGSGAAGRSYLYSRAGFLYQAPVTWYTQGSRWDVSPGFEGDSASRWNRAIEPDCLSCHASQIRSAEGFQNRYAAPPFAQSGIGCERCHGPGSEHIAGRGKLVNPAKLEPKAREGVCAQCHTSGEARVARAGKQLKDYRPGELLSDYVSFFVYDNAGPLRATSYVEKLAGSRCKIASGDRMWCGSCHDPHRVPAASERVAWFRAKCLTCHQPADCKVGKAGDDCAGCHMQKSRVVDVNHGVLTDHGIPRTAGKTSSVATTTWKLQAFSSLDAGERELGLAYAEISARTGDRKQSAEAIRLLESAPRDAEVEVRLADLYQREGEVRRALPLFQSALRKRPTSVVALVNLGNYYGTAGKLKEAIALWRQALKLNPCAAEAAQNLKIALEAEGQIAAAADIVKQQAGCVFG